MEETTFNSAYSSVHSWLHALYNENEATRKNTPDELKKIESIKRLQSELHYTFTNFEHLITALTHSTFCYEFDGLSNERLEFLGDSLVNFIVAKTLYKKFPDSSEGVLSRLRGALVNELALSQLAKSISLGENLLLGKGEFQNNGHQKNSLLADSFEALCAAIYQDSEGKIEVLENVFHKMIERYEQSTGLEFFSLKKLEQFDSKSELQEIVVALFQVFPTYKSSVAPGGFLVELWIGERKIAEAEGPSKKKLEKELARLVLDEKKYQL